MIKNIFIILSLLLLVACASEDFCKGPYFEFQKEQCCLDENENQICDRDESNQQIALTPKASPDSQEHQGMVENNVQNDNSMQESNMPLNTNEKNQEKSLEETQDENLVGKAVYPSQKISTQSFSEKEKQDLIKKFEEKITSLRYRINENNILIKPPFMVIELPSPQRVEVASEDGIKFYYNTITFDVSKMQAVLSCEARVAFNRGFCEDLQNRVIPVPFDEYFEKTPYDWIEILRRNPVISYQPRYSNIEQRPVDYLILDHPKGNVELWIDSTYGVPIKVKTYEMKGESIVYQDLAINSVSLKDLGLN